MSQSSLSRYRLAILAVTALAAGCSIYYIREHFFHEHPPGKSLRRSNAVHRRRTRPTRPESGEPVTREPALGESRILVSRPMLDLMLHNFDARDPEYVYGRLRLYIGPSLVSYELRRNTLPSGAFLRENHQMRPDKADQMSQEIEQIYIEAVLYEHVGPRTTIDHGDLHYLLMQLESRGLRPIPIYRALTRFTRPKYDALRYYSPTSFASNSHPAREDEDLQQHASNDLFDFSQQVDEDQPDAELLRAQPHQSTLSETAADGENEDSEAGAESDESKNDGQSLLNLLYYIAEDQSRKDGYVHRQVGCNQCNTHPIRGIRYRCANCADYDLCEQCESTQVHTPTHIFYKVRIPAPFPFLGNPRQPQPVWYPGKPAGLVRQLSRDKIQRLSSKSKFEDSEIAALWDQFRCLASQPLNTDPFGMAIDHRTFDRCFMPNTSLRSPPPNLIYDLMFSFYDTDGNGLIGFEEFVTGLACLREKEGKLNHEKLRRIFSGYDLDRDGFVSRKDFLRMFRAYYALMKELTRELVAGMEEDASENIQSAQEAAASSQPLSSFFNGHILRGQPSRTGEGKTLDRFGDLVLPYGQEITRDNHDVEGDHHEAVGDNIELDFFGNVARPFIRNRLRSVSLPGTPDTIAEIHNLGDRILDEPDPPHGSDALEYTPNDDRNFNGPRGDPYRNNNTQSNSATEAGPQRTNSFNWPPDWINTSDVEEALGQDILLEDVTDNADRSKVLRAAIKRMALEDRALRQEVRTKGIEERWQRRDFYLDEEDGATQPEGYNKELPEPADAETTMESANGYNAINGHSRASRRFRSSSKVRFEDDVIGASPASRSRSSTSVSSRSVPIGERWGGFEVPEPEGCRAGSTLSSDP